MLIRLFCFSLLLSGLAACGPADNPLDDFQPVDPQETATISLEELNIGSAEELIAMNDQLFVLLDRTANRLHQITIDGSAENMHLDIPSGSDVTSIATDGNGSLFVMDRYEGMVYGLQHEEDNFWSRKFEASFRDHISDMPNRLMVSDEYFFIKSFAHGRPDDEYSEGKIYAFSKDGQVVSDAPKSFRMQNLTRDPLRQSGMPIPVPFSNTTVFDVNSVGNIWLGWSENVELTAYSPEGSEQRKLRYDLTPAEPDMTELDEWLQTMDPELRNTIEAGLPEYLPVMHNLRISDRDEVWMQIMADETTTNTIVFDDDGNSLHQMRLPLDFELKDVFGNTLAGIEQQVTGEQKIRVYTLDLAND